MDKLFKYLCFGVLIMMATISCQKRPSEVLSRKKMENVMYDMYIAEAVIENNYEDFSNPENKEALIDRVLEKHKISEARWDTSLSWYSDNIDIYIRINDSIKSRLERSQQEVQRLIAQRDLENNTFEETPADYIPSNFYLAGIGCDRGFKFTLDSLQLADKFLEEDTIFFRFNALGILPVNTYAFKTMLQMEYADTTIYQSTRLLETKLYSFPILKQVNEQDTIKSLNGFVNLSGKFPPVPIQLYQISLGNNQKNDSASVIDNTNEKELEEQPKMTTE